MRQEEKNSLLNLSSPSPLTPPLFPLILCKFSCPPQPNPPAWLASSCFPVSQPKGARKVCGPEEVKGQKYGGASPGKRGPGSPTTSKGQVGCRGHVVYRLVLGAFSLPALPSPQSLQMKYRTFWLGI